MKKEVKNCIKKRIILLISYLSSISPIIAIGIHTSTKLTNPFVLIDLQRPLKMKK